MQLQESGRFTVFVQQSSAPRTALRAVRMDNGRRYLRTSADMTDDNNLASLPRPPEN